MGRKVAYFGDGFQKRIERFGRKMWWIPTLGGEFVLDRRLGYTDGLMGGNLWFMGEDEDAALAAAEAGVAAIRDCPGVIMPFPGGIAGSGSKAGSKYRFAIASTYEKFCPLLIDDPAANSELPENVRSVMEIIINGRDLNAISPCHASRHQCLGEHPRVASDLGGQLRRPPRQELRLSPSRKTAHRCGIIEQFRQELMEYTVVVAELLLALTMSFLAWRFRRSFSLFLAGILLGMAWCAFLHGFCFGVLRVEGPHAQSDPGALIGFGIATSIFTGVPVGAVLGAVLLAARKRLYSGSNRPSVGEDAVTSRDTPTRMS